MKTLFLTLTGFILFGVIPSGGAAAPRTISDLKIISTRALQRSISPKFYKSLMISPVQGWISVGGNVSGTHVSGLRVVHSELDGRFDSLALQLAKEVQIAGYYSIERPYFGGPVLLHLLVYQIADGIMVLSFPQFTEPGGDQMEYFGCARLAVLKNGNWIEIEGPETLQGKGWAVRQGIKNQVRALTRMEMKPVPNPGWF